MTPELKANFFLIVMAYNLIVVFWTIKELLRPLPKLTKSEESLAKELMNMY